MQNLDLPTTSRAAVITEFNGLLDVRDLPIPELEPGAILVQVEAATVCGSDIHVWDGSLAAGKIRPIDLPVVPGHEMSGVVVAIEGETHYTGGGNVELGDRILFTHGRCGTCYFCTIAQQPNLCPNRQHYGTNCETYPYLVGGFSEYCYVYPKSQKIKVPDNVKPEWASAGSCALRTIMHAYERLGRVEPWQTIVIQGTGPLGLFATAVAKVSGAQQIIVVGAPQDRLDLATEWGATDTISVLDVPNAQDRINRVLELTNGNGAEIVMEWSGAPGAFAEGIDMTRRGGRYLVGGQVGGHEVAIQPAKIMKENLDIIGSFSAAEPHYWQALQFLSSRQDEFDFDRMLTTRYGLHEVHDAFTGMQSLSEIKPVIIPSLTR